VTGGWDPVSGLPYDLRAANPGVEGFTAEQRNHSANKDHNGLVLLGLTGK
jgi:hypothetical protein